MLLVLCLINQSLQMFVTVHLIFMTICFLMLTDFIVVNDRTVLITAVQSQDRGMTFRHFLMARVLKQGANNETLYKGVDTVYWPATSDANGTSNAGQRYPEFYFG
ncbi:hypothetical protein TUM4433_19660 [Shewanella schlegeliana]|nr:hypothetical protein TUM4433_19660 [Shewanella schlegeliana]